MYNGCWKFLKVLLACFCQRLWTPGHQAPRRAVLSSDNEAVNNWLLPPDSPEYDKRLPLSRTEKPPQAGQNLAWENKTMNATHQDIKKGGRGGAQSKTPIGEIPERRIFEEWLADDELF